MGRGTRCLLTLLVFLFPVLMHAQVSTNKLIGYLPYWWNGANFNTSFDRFTHVIYVNPGGVSTSSPFFNSNAIDDGYWFTRFRDSCHAHGGKFLLEVLGGHPAPQGVQIMIESEERIQTWVDTICAYAKKKGCDGVEIDWEFPHHKAQAFSSMLGKIRKKLDAWKPKGTLAIATYYSWLPTAYQADSLNAYCDIIMPMAYTMWMGNGESPYYTGFDTPINVPNSYGAPSHNEALSSPSTIQSFADAGIDKAKLCVGISFEGTRFGGATGLNQQYSSWQFTSTVTNSPSNGYPSVPASGRMWDDQAKANYASSEGYIWSFHDTISVKAIIKFVQERGYGGIMVYDYPAGYDTKVGDVLIRVVERETLRDPRKTRR
jgi:GH18 family chitinase